MAALKELEEFDVMHIHIASIEAFYAADVVTLGPDQAARSRSILSHPILGVEGI
jgi:hypothetical protein